MDQAALLRLDLPSRPEAAAAARKAVRTLNESLHLLGEERLQDLQLLVTELVTNAVRHGACAGGGIVVAFRVDQRILRVDVRDHGLGFDPALVRHPSPGSLAGRGLTIVAALAHRWGVERAAGTTVWFELSPA
jgi:anti-sigma regulatory factor (Ser/Thr protein kinase)